MIWALSALAWAAPPAIWVEGGVGAWRTESCACVDNVGLSTGFGVAVPFGERLGLELRPQLQVAARPFGSGVALGAVSGGVHALTREEAPSLTLGAGISRSWLWGSQSAKQLGVQARVGWRLEPGGWLVEPGLEWTSLQGRLPHSTAALTLRLGRVLAPAPPPR